MLAGRGTTLVRYEQEERVCQSVLVLGESLASGSRQLSQSLLQLPLWALGQWAARTPVQSEVLLRGVTISHWRPLSLRQSAAQRVFSPLCLTACQFQVALVLNTSSVHYCPNPLGPNALVVKAALAVVGSQNPHFPADLDDPKEN